MRPDMTPYQHAVAVELEAKEAVVLAALRTQRIWANSGNRLRKTHERELFDAVNVMRRAMKMRDELDQEHPLPW